MSRSFFIGTEAQLYSNSETFAQKIAADPQAYGLSVLDAANYVSLNATWRSAYAAAIARGTRTVASVIAKNQAAAAVRVAASNLAKRINGTSTVSDQQRLELGLGVRKQRAPLPAPGKPNRIAATVDAIGRIALSWKCVNPRGSAGTIYQIQRQTNGVGEFVHLGSAGTRRFVDQTVPVGVARVTYRIQAIRSTKAGQPEEINVNFGVAENALVENITPLRVAA